MINGITLVVHIGIVTYNSLDDLPRCFEGIRAQIYPHIRVTVLDNVSGDASVEWVRQNAPEAKLIVSEKNVGFGRAHNRIAATRAPGEYYMALNPDVHLLPAYVASLVTALEADTSAGWGTGKLLLPDGQHIYSVGHAMQRDGYALNIGYGMPDGEQFSQSREVFGAPGAAVIIKNTLADAFLFEEAMFLYSEDTDFDWAARRQGWKCLYVAEAVAYHRGSNPRDELRVEAITNRYLSVIKNAYAVDLMFYNLPRIVFHTLMRSILTPSLGIRMGWRLLKLTPEMLRKRRKPRQSRHEMLEWFRWARQQPTAQPRSLRSRLISFRKHQSSS